MGTELTPIERAIEDQQDTYAALLRPIGLAPARFRQTILIALERTSALRELPLPSLLSAAMSSAVIGLEPDGVTGQLFWLPFWSKRLKHHVCQPVIGYKGFNTLAARAGFAIHGATVREGDDFHVDLGSGTIRHVPDLRADRAKRRLIAVWARGERADGIRTTPVVLTEHEVVAIKQRSPGARKPDSPWNDPLIGYPAMAEKSAKRRLARSLPFAPTPGTPFSQYHMAAAMDEAVEERGLSAHLRTDGALIVDGKAVERPAATERFVIHTRDGERECQSIEDYRTLMLRGIDSFQTSEKQLKRFRERNYEQLHAYLESEPKHVHAILAAFDRRVAPAGETMSEDDPADKWLKQAVTQASAMRTLDLLTAWHGENAAHIQKLSLRQAQSLNMEIVKRQQQLKGRHK